MPPTPDECGLQQRGDIVESPPPPRGMGRMPQCLLGNPRRALRGVQRSSTYPPWAGPTAAACDKRSGRELLLPRLDPPRPSSTPSAALAIPDAAGADTTAFFPRERLLLATAKAISVTIRASRPLQGRRPTPCPTDSSACARRTPCRCARNPGPRDRGNGVSRRGGAHASEGMLRLRSVSLSQTLV